MTSREILDFINAPKEIKNIEDLQKIVSSSTNLTLIEYVFFQNFEMVVKDILVNRIKGDIVNIGVYKGGGSLYMKSRFEESGVSRKWYLFDSFKGFNESKLMNMKDLNALNFFKENIDFSYDFPSSKYVLNLFERFFHRE